MRSDCSGVHVLGIIFEESGWPLHPVSVVCAHNLPVRPRLNVPGANSMLGPHRRWVLTAIPSQSRANLGSALAIESLTDRLIELLIFLSLTATGPIRSIVITFKKMAIKVNLLYRFSGFHRE